jgi:class 3 adenylate cyclase/DNA-binding SARP family transcriptional activator
MSGDVVLATVLFTDIVGSTERAVAIGDDRWAQLLRRHHALVRSQLAKFSGRELGSTGDGFFASFEAPGQAVRCGASIAEAVRGIGLSIRAGVHTGECERIGDTLDGVAVHIGARICAEAGPDEVLVSGTVRDLLAGSGLTFLEGGLRTLKGLPGDWHVYRLDAAGLAENTPARVWLCGRLVIELGNRRIEDTLPGHQGRVLFAYLAVNRRRPVSRDELIDALWMHELPQAAETNLSALLSKLRRCLGADRLDGRGTLQLQLPQGSWIDLEAALEAIHRAESAAKRSDWAAAWSAARVSLHIARRPFLVGEDLPWIDDVRSELSDVHQRSLEVTAQAGLAIGGAELDTAERSARTLIKEAAYRESGYRLLMEVQATRGNAAEALHTYEILRQRLRDDLGASPSTATEELHRRLLG